MRAVALALVTLAGCGRVNFGAVGDAGDVTNPPPPDFVNGSRLRALAWTSGDAAEFYTWHDELIDENCFLLTADDGVMRCLPSNTTVEEHGFADAACTQHVATRTTPSDACSAPGYGVLFSSDGMGNTRDTTYTLAGPHTGQIYSDQAGCAPQLTNANTDYFDVGTRVPPTMFVAAHEERTRNHDLSYIETVFDDGARVLLPALFDERSGTTCSLLVVTVDSAICLPVGTQYGGFAFKDAACTQGVLVSTTASDMPIMLEGDELCGDRLRAFKRGAPYNGPLYGLDSSGCAPYSGQQAFEVIAAAPDEYRRFQRSIRPGAGRVREARWTSADGIDLIASPLWDAQRGAWCRPMLDTATQTKICAPWATPLAASTFSDAACTVSVPVDPVCVETEGAQIRSKSTPPYVSCETFFAEAHVYDQPVVLPLYLRSLNGCVPVDSSTSVFGLDTATAVPAASYAPLELR